MLRYSGKKHLNSNLYKQISLKSEAEDVKVKVSLDERFKMAQLLELDTKVITEQIDGLSDFEKIKEIVLYFLRNNRICSIEEYDNKIVVTSTSSRRLILQLNRKYQELLDIIIKKYENDRLQFLDTVEYDTLYIQGEYFDIDRNRISRNCTNYYVGKDKETGNIAVVLTLFDNKNGISSFDKNFIMNYLNELINADERYIVYVVNKLGGHLYTCDKSIRLPFTLTEDLKSVVSKRNYEILKMRGRQYKLEGIK